MARSPDVLVVGGGIVGTAIAFRLAKDGLAVTLLEYGEWLTAHGRSDSALPLIAEAREIFERLKAEPWLDRADAVTAREVATASGSP